MFLHHSGIFGMQPFLDEATRDVSKTSALESGQDPGRHPKMNYNIVKKTRKLNVLY